MSLKVEPDKTALLVDNTINSPVMQDGGAAAAPVVVQDLSALQIQLSSLPPSIHHVLKDLDADNGGSVDVTELVAAVNALKASRKQSRLLTKVVIGMVVCMVMLLLGNFGLTYMVVQLASETKITGGAMTSKADGSVIATANTEFTVSSSGTMQSRKASTTTTDTTNTAQNSSVSTVDSGASWWNGRRLETVTDSEDADTSPGELSRALATRTAYQKRQLSSTMPEQYFTQLQWLNLESSTGATAAFKIDSVFRIPHKNAKCGSHLVLVTSCGKLVLDDTDMTFSHEVGQIFSEAGFTVEAAADSGLEEIVGSLADSSGTRRRLTGTFTMVGFFNEVDDYEWQCTTVEKPSMPAVYSSRTTLLQSCTDASGEDSGDCTIEVNGDHYLGISGKFMGNIPAFGVEEDAGHRFMPITRQTVVNETHQILVEEYPLHPGVQYVTVADMERNSMRSYQVQRVAGLGKVVTHCSEQQGEVFSLGLPDEYIFYYKGEADGMRHFRITYKATVDEDEEWLHIDYYDDAVSLQPKLLISDSDVIRFESMTTDRNQFFDVSTVAVTDAQFSQCVTATGFVDAGYLRVGHEGKTNPLLYNLTNNAGPEPHSQALIDDLNAVWNVSFPYPPPVSSSASWSATVANYYLQQPVLPQAFMDWFYGEYIAVSNSTTSRLLGEIGRSLFREKQAFVNAVEALRTDAEQQAALAGQTPGDDIVLFGQDSGFQLHTASGPRTLADIVNPVVSSDYKAQVKVKLSLQRSSKGRGKSTKNGKIPITFFLQLDPLVIEIGMTLKGSQGDAQIDITIAPSEKLVSIDASGCMYKILCFEGSGGISFNGDFEAAVKASLLVSATLGEIGIPKWAKPLKKKLKKLTDQDLGRISVLYKNSHTIKSITYQKYFQIMCELWPQLINAGVGKVRGAVVATFLTWKSHSNNGGKEAWVKLTAGMEGKVAFRGWKNMGKVEIFKMSVTDLFY